MDNSCLSMAEAAKLADRTLCAMYMAIKNGKLKVFKKNDTWKTTWDDLKEYFRTKSKREFSKKPNGEILFDNSKGVYSVHQLAKLAEISPHWIYWKLREKELPYKRFKSAYLIQLADFEKLVGRKF